MMMIVMKMMMKMKMKMKMKMTNSVFKKVYQCDLAYVLLYFWSLKSLLLLRLFSQQVTSNELWPEYEIRNEDEMSLIPKSDDNEHDKQLVLKKRLDGTIFIWSHC
ncbi:uncharacterized protein LOC126675127 [Mercurialis annua]|uniref:uncharacterized protein LOC126675127 n=1 Tax=Mercurialis annua TaxID=3986 RepID=UPI00215EF7D9|nr:uncharacterized protein LOC126675127 [Mercurialis annua]